MPTSINNYGQIPGDTATPDGTVSHAFLWSQATGAIDIGPLNGYSYNEPNALNNTGFHNLCM